jgi:transposase-like protein
MNDRLALFHKRQFAAEIIVTCVRWYLRFALSLRDVEEMMAERGRSVDHRTVWRWTLRYAPRDRVPATRTSRAEIIDLAMLQHFLPARFCPAPGA